jgi:hypothetical protein
MAERHGGMRRPQNPAPVSGPGQLSQRTDGGPQQVQAEMSGMPYGENQAMDAIQSAAPLAASGQATARATRRGGAGRQAASAAGMGGTPLMSPTQRPDEPVTAGAPFGPGAGPMPTTMYQQPQTPRLSDTLRKIESASGDPTISRITEILARRGL